jgi:hypothetical protein
MGLRYLSDDVSDDRCSFVYECVGVHDEMFCDVALLMNRVGIKASSPYICTSVHESQSAAASYTLR